MTIENYRPRASTAISRLSLELANYFGVEEAIDISGQRLIALGQRFAGENGRSYVAISSERLQ